MSIDKIKLVGNEKWEPLKGLNVQFYMDSSTGKFKVISTYNDMLIKSVILEGGVAARASSLSLILRDLESAYGWYKRALEIVQSDSIKNDSDDDYIEIDNLSISSEARAFFVASITFYGKAFTEAVGRKLKMEKNGWTQDFMKCMILLSSIGIISLHIVEVNHLNMLKQY
ncbi:TPA: hypothetical protein R4216_000436 [Citrobacter freundii]|nr:hypothetical protein [Citrobacter freundii]HED3835984.1 hypothetical protein [Citrobacter freundii]HED3841418.1 hypothetical protein [Citrobacter freundii]